MVSQPGTFKGWGTLLMVFDGRVEVFFGFCMIVEKINALQVVAS